MAFFDFLKPKSTAKHLSFSDPVFVKESNRVQEQINKLEQYRTTIIPQQLDELEKEIRILSSGLRGEKTVAYELKNSYLPLLILEDLYLKNQDITAQIDFVVISPAFILVIECKKLLDDIEITEKGDFYRCFKNASGQIYKKEGMYSPITQNQRHIDMVKKLLSDQIDFFDPQKFSHLVQSIIVLANPKTVVQDATAPQDIKEKIIKHDQLIAHLKKLQSSNTSSLLDETKMNLIADVLMKAHQEKSVDLAGKYEFQVPVCPKCQVPMVLRTAKKGANIGKEFFGCPNYPKCRYIVNMD